MVAMTDVLSETEMMVLVLTRRGMPNREVVWWGETADKWSSTQWASMDWHEESPGRWCLDMSTLGGCCCVKKGSWCRKVEEPFYTQRLERETRTLIHSHKFINIILPNLGRLSRTRAFCYHFLQDCKGDISLLWSWLKLWMGKNKPCNGQCPSTRRRDGKIADIDPIFLRSEIELDHLADADSIAGKSSCSSDCWYHDKDCTFRYQPSPSLYARGHGILNSPALRCK